MEKGLESSRKEIEQLKTWIAESDQIVFFGGAGVSTEIFGARMAFIDRNTPILPKLY